MLNLDDISDETLINTDPSVLTLMIRNLHREVKDLYEIVDIEEECHNDIKEEEQKDASETLLKSMIEQALEQSFGCTPKYIQFRVKRC